MKQKEFEETLLKLFDKNRIDYYEWFNGYIVKCNMDTWYIEIGGHIENDICHVNLFHKNLYYSSGKTSSIPDFHVQFKKQCTTIYLLKYIKRHGKKFANKKIS